MQRKKSSWTANIEETSTKIQERNFKTNTLLYRIQTDDGEKNHTTLIISRKTIESILLWNERKVRNGFKGKSMAFMGSFCVFDSSLSHSHSVFLLFLLLLRLFHFYSNIFVLFLWKFIHFNFNRKKNRRHNTAQRSNFTSFLFTSVSLTHSFICTFSHFLSHALSITLSLSFWRFTFT